jgi:hypothetical protein
MEMFMKVCFASERKEARASEVRRADERDRLGVGTWWTTQATSMET